VVRNRNLETPSSLRWVESEIQLVDVRWRNLDIKNIVEGRNVSWVDNPDLSRVEEPATALAAGGLVSSFRYERLESA
jgi:hypothetical protein